jgi:glycerophosphoryl diester phosphodiesterase
MVKAIGGEVNAQDLNDNFSELDSKITEVAAKNEGVRFSDLPEPIYLAHRGAKHIFPEMSIEAYRGCVNMGLNVLEMDIRQATDGTLICHHDDTMERTTNKTGSVDYYSAMGFRSAKIDLLPGWTGTPTLFEDLVREFGKKVVYAPELKGAGLSEKLVDTLIAHDLQEHAVVQSFSAPDLVYAISNGIPAIYLKAQADVTPATILGWGIKRVGLSTALSDSYVTDCINAGLKVYMYTVNRRYEHDKYLAMGVHGFFTDDPLWIRGDSPVLEWDPYRDQVFTHGQFSPAAIADYTDGNRGSFISPNKFGWENESTGSDFSLQGWAGELSTSFTLDFKVKFTDLASSVRWASVAFCTPLDYFDDYTDAKSSGYHLLLRENGTLELYLRNGGPASQLQSVSTTAISEGQTVDIRVAVSGSSITVTRLGTGGGAFTVNNTIHRNGFLHFGRRYTGVTFENVHVARQ